MTNVVDGKTFKLSAHVGRSLAIVPIEFRPNIKTKDYGIKPAWKCDVVSLSGDDAGTRYSDVLFFHTAIMSQIKKHYESDDVVLIGAVEVVESANTDETGNPYTYFAIADTLPAEIVAAARFGV